MRPDCLLTALRRVCSGNFIPKPTQPALLFLHGVPPRYSEEAVRTLPPPRRIDLPLYQAELTERLAPCPGTQADEFSSVDLSATDNGLSEDHIRRLVRRCFERSVALTRAEGGAREREALEDGFMALRLLAEQQRLRDCSSVRVAAPGLRIECTAAVIEGLAPPPGDPQHGHHAFAYRVSIEKQAPTRAPHHNLISRDTSYQDALWHQHWHERAVSTPSDPTQRFRPGIFLEACLWFPAECWAGTG